MTCPACGARLEAAESIAAKRLTCPRCLASLTRPDFPVEETEPREPRSVARRRVAPPEGDVGWDTAFTGAGLIALGGLGAFGIVIYLFGGVQYLDTTEKVQTATVLTLGLGVVLLGLVIAGIVFGAISRTTAAKVALSVIGSVVLIGLVVLLVASMFIYAVAGCFAQCNRSTNPPPHSVPKQ